MHEDRPAPSWAGDVSVGVDAWTRRASTPPTLSGSSTEGPGEGSAERSGKRSATRSATRSTRRAPGRSPAATPADPVADGPEADPESVARTILLDQLTGRARSRKELSDKLASRNVPEDVATRLLDRFEEVGLVDDPAFARAWVAGRGAQGGKGLATRALAQELRRKGVPDEVAREALAEVDPAEEENAARALVRRKLRSLRGVDDTVATRRLVAMLARKGYPAGLAFAAVREELAAADRTPPDGLETDCEVD